MSSFLSGISSYIPNRFDLAKLAIVGGSAAACYSIAGIPAALFVIGGAFLTDQYSRPRVEPAPITTQLTGIKDGIARDAELSLNETLPTQIKWRNNSCYVSSIMWSFFLNEPTVLQEIPRAIRRRLNENELFTQPIRTLIESEYDPRLFELGTLLNKGTALSREDIGTALKLFRSLYGIQSANTQKFNELLALLEMYQLIDECQKTKYVDGARINHVTQYAQLIRPTYVDMAGRPGDSGELIHIFGDLIFDGSKYAQNCSKHCEAKGLVEDYSMHPSQALGEQQRNWGHLEIAPTKSGQTIKELIQSHFFEDSYQAEYRGREQSYGQTLPFQVRARLELETAPPVLVVTVKRQYDSQNPHVPKFVGRSVNPRMHLEGNFFRDRKGAEYQLMGATKWKICGVPESRQSVFAHYTATTVKPDGQTYFCDDLRGAPELVPFSRLKEEAEQADVLIYRRM